MVTPVAELSENGHVREAIETAIDDDGRVSVSLFGPELRTLRERMAPYPTFGSRWYVRQEDTTVTVTDWCSSRL